MGMVLSTRRRDNAAATLLRTRKPLTEVVLLSGIILLLGVNMVRVMLETSAQPVQALAISQSPNPKPFSSTNAGATTTSSDPLPVNQPQTEYYKPNIETPRSCTGTRYTLPEALNLSSMAPGLAQQIESPTYYTVYGSSVSALRDAVMSCSLRAAAGPYHATTAYQINWAYTPVAQNGSCSLKDVKVGLHVNQLMPAFSPGSTISTEVRSTWDTYARALQTHEDGHTAINIDYATRLNNALQSLGQMDCSTLTRQVQTTIDSHVAMLNTANELYDAQTNHGATQGAVL